MEKQLTFETITENGVTIWQSKETVPGSFALHFENSSKVSLSVGVTSIEDTQYQEVFSEVVPPIWDHDFVVFIPKYVRIRCWSQPSSDCYIKY